jgi:ATP-binding cassette, subfamily C, bacterial
VASGGRWGADPRLVAVGAHAWVDALPDGMATVVGEGGHQLTPTQAQQLALARVALAAKPIVVLDEATAVAGGTPSAMTGNLTRTEVTPSDRPRTA